MDTFLTIAEVAQRTGLSAHTLRYYERIGLLGGVARAPGGQRRYAASDMEWIGFLQRLRATGMPIQDMLVFARLRSEGPATVSARRALLETHLSDVLAHVQSLRQSAKVLQDKIGHYRKLEALPSPASTQDGGSRHEPERTLRKRTGQATGNRR